VPVGGAVEQESVAAKLVGAPSGSPTGLVRGPESPELVRVGVGVWLAVLVTGCYGGYFGAAQGVLLIGLLATFLPITWLAANALKNLLATTANATAAVIFVVAAGSRVDWSVAAMVAGGSVVGGWVGARYGRRLSARGLRRLVLAVGCLAAAKLAWDTGVFR
jgi:uncharacterized membrane protein YfcA